MSGAQMSKKIEHVIVQDILRQFYSDRVTGVEIYEREFVEVTGKIRVPALAAAIIATVFPMPTSDSE